MLWRLPLADTPPALPAGPPQPTVWPGRRRPPSLTLWSGCQRAHTSPPPLAYSASSSLAPSSPHAG